jgi:hypothetical protein
MKNRNIKILHLLGVISLILAIGCTDGRKRNNAGGNTDATKEKNAVSIGWESLSFVPQAPQGLLSGENPKRISKLPEIFSVDSTKDFIRKASSFAVDSYVIDSDPSAPKGVLWRAVRRK